MAVYSYSKIDTFEKCPQKFKFRYIDKIKPKPTINIVLGKSVHNTLEWLYKNVIENKTAPEITEIIDFFKKEWKKLFSQDIIKFFSDLPEPVYFNRGVSFLISYYMAHKPFDDNTLEVEKEIFIDIDTNGEHQIWGFIDRLAFNKDENLYEIHDYKTSNSHPSKEKIQADKQLPIYALAIKKTFGENIRVKLVWHYLAHGLKIEKQKSVAELETVKRQVLKTIQEIESSISFPTKKGPLCNWCDYKDICPAWNNVGYRHKRERQTIL